MEEDGLPTDDSKTDQDDVESDESIVPVSDSDDD